MERQESGGGLYLKTVLMVIMCSSVAMVGVTVVMTK